jgi:hypothetical protein
MVLKSQVVITKESKKERYYISVKPEVKNKLFKLNKNKISFTKFIKKAIKINNRQFKHKQERKAKKNKTQPRFQPQANQGKK